MPDQQQRRRFRVTRGLFRLWVVATAFWILAVTFAFWSGNGGTSARWVWSGAEVENASENGQHPTPKGFISDQEALAMNQPAPNSSTKTAMTPEEFFNQPGPPVIITQQLGAFLLLAFMPPALLLALGASVVWAIKGFRA